MLGSFKLHYEACFNKGFKSHRNLKDLEVQHPLFSGREILALKIDVHEVDSF